MSCDSDRILRSNSKMGRSSNQILRKNDEMSSGSEDGYGKFDSDDSLADFVASNDEIEEESESSFSEEEEESSSESESLSYAAAAKSGSKAKKVATFKKTSTEMVKAKDDSKPAVLKNAESAEDVLIVEAGDSSYANDEKFSGRVSSPSVKRAKINKLTVSKNAMEAQASSSAVAYDDEVPERYSPPYSTSDALELPYDFDRVPTDKYTPYMVFSGYFPRIRLYRSDPAKFTVKMFVAERNRVRSLWDNLPEEEYALYAKACEELSEIWEHESPKGKYYGQE